MFKQEKEFEPKNKKKIRYVKDYNEIDEEVIIPIYEIATIDTNYIKVYQTVLSRLVGLNNMSGNFIIYLASIMDNNNYVKINKETKLEFIKFMKNLGLTYSLDSLYKNLTELTNLNLLIRIEKGKYFINPKYFCKTDELSRERIVKFVLEIDSSNNKILLLDKVKDFDKKFELEHISKRVKFKD